MSNRDWTGVEKNANVKRGVINRLVVLVMATLIGLLVVACLLFSKENSQLRSIVMDSHIEAMWEGVVVAVAEDGGTVYVMVEELGDDFVIEVDVYNRIIHTSIEVGDKAYFLVDNSDPNKWTDADLIAIEKRENECLLEGK